MKLWSWLFFGLSGMSFGLDLYHHELKSYPRGEGCQQTAQNLAERLHLVSGAEIYWTGFTKETETVCDIKISYLAAQPIAFSQNSDSIAFGAINQGIKAKMEDCQLELQREEKLFRQFTGIEPWISYCYKGDSFLDPMPYFAFVEGIGKGTLQFFSSEAIVGVRPNGSWKDAFTGTYQAAEKLGIGLVSILGRPYISELDMSLTVRFYGNKRLYLNSEQLAEHQDPSICELQIGEVRAGLAQAQVPPLAVYCGKYSDKRYQLTIVTLSENILGLGDLKFLQDPKTFESLEHCRNEKPKILEFYRNQLGKKSLAGFCANPNGPFQITVVEEKTPQR